MRQERQQPLGRVLVGTAQLLLLSLQPRYPRAAWSLQDTLWHRGSQG